MSAIAGIINLCVDEAAVSAALHAMPRRGTDRVLQYVTPTAAFIQTGCCSRNTENKLAMLEHGCKQYVISFSGKVYNPGELRHELQHLGYTFYDHSDEELLLRAYAQWGAACLDKCNGVFSFALLETISGRVFLARDRIGVKPLFYMEQGSGLLFASQMKTILAYPGVNARLDADGAAQLLLIGPGRVPGSGVFQNMKELEPGCYGIYENGKLRIQRYWKLTDGEHTDSFEDTAETVRSVLSDAVRRQISGELSAGAMLSGGLDSGIIAALCAEELKRKGGQLKTFSLDYRDNEKYFTPGKFQPNADPEYIQIMRDYLQTQHFETVLTPQNLVDGIYDATVARDLPGMADVDSSLLAFCEKIRQHTAVVFSGECADEIFGGYPWYRDPKIRNVDGFPWSQTLPQRIGMMHSWITESIEPYAFVRERYEQTVSECDILPKTDGTERRMKEMMNLNFRWFMQTLLDRNDRMSAYHGLEVRVPFCDYRIAQYLYRVPWQMKDYGGMEKGLLRYAFRDILPESIRLRKKSPFPKTHDPAYQIMASKMLKAIIHDKNAPIFRLVRTDALEELLHRDFSWPWYGQLMRGPQTMMYMVQLNQWLKHYSVEIVG